MEYKDNKLKKLIILVSIIIVIVVSGFVYAKGTPQYSLYQLRKAIKNHDADTAMRYFDVDSIVVSQINDIVGGQGKKNPINELNQVENNIIKERMAKAIPVIKETFKNQFIASITTPSDEETPVSIIKKGKFSDFEIDVLGEMAILSRKDNINIGFKMVKTKEGYWKIVQLMTPDSMQGVSK